MKILSANKFYYVYGGSDRYFFELNKLHERAGHEVIPFAMKHPRNFSTPYENYFVSQVNYWDNPTIIEKIQAAGRVLYSSEARAQVRKIIADKRPDITHLHLISHQISPSFLPELRKSGIPIIQTLHDYKPICPTYSLYNHDEICERCEGKKFVQATLVRCNHESLVWSALSSVEMYMHHALGYYNMPDIYITPSDFQRRKMIQYGIAPEKLVHVPNFVDTDHSYYEQTKEKQFVFIGRLVPVKGLNTLIESMKILSLSEYRLLIVGDGPERAGLERYVQENNITNVDFLGYQDKQNVYNLLSQSVFSVVPSIWYENCPYSILESMAVGTPVIGSRIGGIPELIDDGIDGYLFEPKNAEDLAQKILAMISKPQLSTKMGIRAKQKIERRYSSQTHHENIMSLYNKLLS